MRGALIAALIPLALACGCNDDANSLGRLDVVWGRLGVSDGRLQKPRAMRMDKDDHLYIVDMTARIQVFTPDGEFLRGWRTPLFEFGRPTGLEIDRHNHLLVADTHYFRILIYSLEGELLQTLGGKQGHGPGEFGFVTHAIRDAHDNLYVAEYGEYDRIQKFTPGGEFLKEWGGHGSAPGQLIRPQKMAIDAQQHIWVTDACNHRIQVFDTEGKLLKLWGSAGSGPGQLYYPYDLSLDDAGNVYVCEYGNHRVQKFTPAGESLGCWGNHGRGPGELNNPWALVRDHVGRLYVLDTNNHRVQRVIL